MNNAKIRRKQNTLIICGWGVLVFGIWSVIRFILMITLEYGYYVEANILPVLTEQDLEAAKTFVTVFSIVFILLVSLGEVALRFFIAHRAGMQGRGIKTGPAYLVWVVVILIEEIASVWTVIGYIYSETAYTLSDVVGNLLLSITDIVILIDLFIAAIGVRQHIRKSLKAKASDNH